MITETLTEYMKKIELEKEMCFYKDKEKGIQYPLTPQHLLARVDYMELDKGEVEKYKFEQKIDKKDYTMFDCIKPVSKYQITKNKEDMYTITDMKFKGTHIWNVTNQAGIHETFENKEDANKLCNSINEQIRNLLKD
jgi:hypothetical protein